MYYTQPIHIYSRGHRVLFIALILLLASCDEYGLLQNATEGTDQCVSCHTDKDLLKEIADPIEHSEGSGEG